MYPNLYPQKQTITRVNGRAGAEMYQLAPDSSVLLLDETAPVVWVKMTDGAGYGQLNGFEIKPMEPEESELTKIQKRLDNIEKMLEDKKELGISKSESTS